MKYTVKREDKKQMRDKVLFPAAEPPKNLRSKRAYSALYNLPRNVFFGIVAFFALLAVYNNIFPSSSQHSRPGVISASPNLAATTSELDVGIEETHEFASTLHDGASVIIHDKMATVTMDGDSWATLSEQDQKLAAKIMWLRWLKIYKNNHPRMDNGPSGLAVRFVDLNGKQIGSWL